MRVCRKCGDKYSLVNHPTYPSGTPKPDCRPCIALYAKKQRAKRKTRPQYVPDYTEMRDPDPAVMEAKVQELIKKYAEEEAIINKAHLPFVPEAGLCDKILKG